MTSLLIIDDDKGLDQLLSDYLAGQGYSVRAAENGKLGLRAMYERQPDIILLDVTMPDKDGWETLRRIREISNVPVIMLTAKGEEDDRVRGLELGADDYITKPFSPRELVSRVKAVIRRTEGASGSMHDIIEVDDRLKIDFDRREVWLEGKLVKLRPTEYRLLYHLVQNAGWVVTHDQLLVKVWGYEYRDEPHYVRLYINYLRQKLEVDAAQLESQAAIRREGDLSLENLVRARFPELCDTLAVQMVEFLRKVRELNLRKAPSVSETLDWAQVLSILHTTQLTPEVVANTVGAIAKHQADLQHVKELAVQMLG